jgi:hypothetical protein
MDPDLYRYDDRYIYDRKKANLFWWTVAILLLSGMAIATWMGIFYVIGQPERPESYRVLKKLHKIEPPKRFELTAAPAGEFLSAKQLYERYSAMRPAELAQADAVLTRNYIRNFQQVRGLVTYVIGRYTIMDSRELKPDDVFSSGVAALTRSVERAELLMEHIYTTADARDARLLRQTLVRGLDVKLERAHDLSAVIHTERLADGRIQITAIPLLYGSYAVTRGTGTFSLEPPADLNLVAGWPIFKERERHQADVAFDGYRERLAPAAGAMPIAGIQSENNTPAPSADALVRVEAALPMPVEKTPPPGKGGKVAARTSAAGKAGKNAKATAVSTPSPTPPLIAKATQRAPAPTLAPSVAPATSPTPTATIPVAVAVAATPPMASPSATIMVLPAIAVATPPTGLALASTTGATWKTFPPGAMPEGRLINTPDLREIADRGTNGERIYLKGQFVVNFADGNRAVLRAKNKLTDSVLHFGAKTARIIVDYPAGSTLPEPGSTLNRDEARPYEVTEVRRQADGQINVFVREIIKQ